MNDQLYVSLDANLIGKKIEKFILGEELEELAVFSKRLSETVNMIEKSILSMGGQVYMAAGDNVLAKISRENLEELVTVWKDNIPTELFSFSVGIGDTAVEAYLAIKYAKVSGYFAVICRNKCFERL